MKCEKICNNNMKKCWSHSQNIMIVIFVFYVEAQNSYIIVLHDNFCYIQFFFCFLYSINAEITQQKTNKYRQTLFEYEKKSYKTIS